MAGNGNNVPVAVIGFAVGKCRFFSQHFYHQVNVAVV